MEYDIYHQALEQSVLAERIGFDYVWAVEHHGLTGYSSCTSPEVFLTWVAANTERVRIGHGVVQTAKGVNHLVRVAERVGALDIVSNGRVEFGSGRGFTHAELQVFGVSPGDTRPMQLHAMRNLPKIWAEGSVELDDEFYQVPRTRVHPRVVQRPHPPMWMACTQPDTWKIAGELGCGVLAFGFAEPGQLEQAIAEYREAIANCNTPYGVVNDQIAFAPPMFCHEDENTALETAAPGVQFFVESNFGYVMQWAQTEYDDYRYYRDIGEGLLQLPELTEQEKAGLSPSAALLKAGVKSNLFCVGTPEQCREFCQYYFDAGIDQLIFNCQLGHIGHDDIMGSLRLFGSDVLPKLRTT
jgi:alkanesulfonate monooxygenase SsuD/methylene tetrahydromethanopterin reductase-like flavin-dependent oxidoreductase (luciferase family)